MNKKKPEDKHAKNALRSYLGQDFIFIHINKTGGISLGKTLNLPYKMHFEASEVIDAIGLRKWRKALSFSIVRNPFDKVVSHYSYRVKTDQTNMGDGHIDFKTWVAKTYGPKKDPFYYDQKKMFQPQLDWLRHDGKIAVDLILRFEKLESDYNKLKSILKLSSDLPHLNLSSRLPYAKYYDEESWNQVAHWFAKDIKYFGYSDKYPA